METLIETKRPAMYRAMKYWGKKPHNIWQKIILENTKVGDVVYDPFAGSAITFFESLIINRKPIINDINPLTKFCVDVYSEEYDIKKIKKIFLKIKKEVSDSENYKQNYKVICKNCGQLTDLYNYRFSNESVDIAYKCSHCKKVMVHKCEHLPTPIENDFWKPTFDMNNLTTISKETIRKFGGNSISNLWRCENIEILSHILEIIKKLKEPYKKIFVFAFLQIVHLTSKMCAVRGSSANRALSTSWGRPAYMALSKYMSQNPLIQLERSLFGNSGLTNALKSIKNRVGHYKYGSETTDFLLSDGVVTNTSSEFNIPYKVDFIITDPPYGNIIQYGELSMIWNVWLSHIYPEYKSNLNNEIIISKSKSRSIYENGMIKVFENCYKSLKTNGKMVFTFNSNSVEDWISIKKIVKSSNFYIEDFYLQKNLRSSEANVKSKKGISISDYYILLSKNKEDKSVAKSRILEDLILKGNC